MKHFQYQVTHFRAQGSLRHLCDSNSHQVRHAPEFYISLSFYIFEYKLKALEKRILIIDFYFLIQTFQSSLGLLCRWVMVLVLVNVFSRSEPEVACDMTL